MSNIKLKEFYRITESLVAPKRKILQKILNKETINDSDIQPLVTFKERLSTIINSGKASFTIKEGMDLLTDISYEYNEIIKDLIYLNSGNFANYSFLDKFNHDSFAEEVKLLTNYLSGLDSSILITDRDGTVNNYCARYLTSVQSIYNAYFLSLFAKNNQMLILTSAPLINKGMADISLFNNQNIILAGSKGREYINKEKKLKTLPIPNDKQNILNCFNSHLEKLLNNEEFEVFNYIGSGVQHKFGQTTVARQDISNIIPQNLSLKLLEEVKEICRSIDPENKYLFIEDTGLDLEIILSKDDPQSSQDFNKGDGIKFLNESENLNLSSKTLIICGDTASDIPMVEKALEYTRNIKVVFVTEKQEIKDKLTNIFQDSFFVKSPDVLISAFLNISV